MSGEFEYDYKRPPTRLERFEEWALDKLFRAGNFVLSLTGMAILVCIVFAVMFCVWLFFAVRAWE